MSFSIPTTFKNIGHFIASNAKKFVAFSAEADVVIGKIEADKPTADALASILGPMGSAVENAAYAALGIIGQILDDTSKATLADGLSKEADQAVIDQIKQAIAFVKQPRPATKA